MISTLIFSKDRPAQLDLLLQSMIQNAPDIFEISVLYTYTDNSFYQGYQQVQQKYPSYQRFNWVQENDFKEDLENWMEKTWWPHVCFFTDDDIFYRPTEITYASIKQIFSMLDLCCVSLRLGMNTIVQDQYASTHTVLPPFQHLEELLIWVWKNAQYNSLSNFFYPFSVDGHIFQKRDIYKTIQSLQYNNPNELEGEMFSHRFILPPAMACLGQSVVVNTPLNLVGSSSNRAGEKFGISLKEFNDNYLDGKRIDLHNIDFSDIKGCHQELRMEMIDAS